MFADVDSDNFSCPSFGQFDRLDSITAAKVDHNHIFRLFPNALAEQLFQFADTMIRTAVAITRFSVGTEPAKQAVPKSSTNYTHRTQARAVARILSSALSKLPDMFSPSINRRNHISRFTRDHNLSEWFASSR